MIPSAVVDTSIVLRWFVQDRWSDAAVAAAEGYKLIAPAFIRIEVANALRNQVRFNDMKADVALRHLEGLGVSMSIVEDGPLLQSAFRIAMDRDHAVYDCIYLALALRQGIPLVTADMRLARKFTDFPGLQIVTPEPV